MERLSSLDASFLYIESDDAPMNIGSVSIFSPPAAGFDHEKLVHLIKRRLAFVPRYRQRVKDVPFGVFRPVWVDDTAFDVSYHVRRSALPKPGTQAQLDELVARLMSRPLDRSRPLWEMYLIEGLADSSFAIVTKSHEALVDGLAALDISQVILDSQADASAGPPDSWRPGIEPTGIELLSASVTEVVTKPAAALDFAVTQTRDALLAARNLVTDSAQTAVEVTSELISLARFRSRSPLKAKIGAQRRFASVDIDLKDLRDIKVAAQKVGVQASVNDIILAVLTGALRTWLIRRDGLPGEGELFRALVPVSLEPDLKNRSERAFDHDGRGEIGGPVHAYLLDLPVGESEPSDRLENIVDHMVVLDPTHEFMGAGAFIDIAGFGPATLHALGARVASTLSRRAYDVTVTNVPGPQHSLYAAGSRMTASYPCIPLVGGQALSIGVTSYNGEVFIGLMADRDALADIAVIAESISASVVGLLASLEQRRIRASNGPRLRVVGQ